MAKPFKIKIDKKNRITIDINLDTYQKNLEKAQKVLDMQIFTDMIDYMPMNEGNFIKLSQQESDAMAGTGYVCAASGKVPYARFLYEGKLMVGPNGSAWAKKGEKKHVTSKDLVYTGSRKGFYKVKGKKKVKTWYDGPHKEAQSHWFDKAKKEHQVEWEFLVHDVITTGKAK